LNQAIQQTLHEGGLTLWVLLVLAVAIYAILFKVWRMISSTRHAVSEKEWVWTTLTENAAASKNEPLTHREVERSYAAFELDQMGSVERRIPFLAVLISSAPLLGLLGTVAGMLITFTGMAKGNGAPIDTISIGISKALVTTQAGLVIAIPAAFLLALLKRKTETTHLELQKQLHTRLAENSKLQTPNSKLQTPNSKLQTPNSKLQTPNSKF
jgi:biopolymer transport protein ExbB